MTKLYLVTTSRVVEEDWRVYAKDAEEAQKIIGGIDPDSDERVVDITELGYENLTIIETTEVP